MSNLALKSGTSLISNFVNGIGLQTSDMLKQSLQKLERAGFKSELIAKNIPIQTNFTLFNYSLVSSAFTKLQVLSKQDKDINFDKVIFDLSQQYNELKNYYVSLLTKPQPLLNMTQIAVQGRKYLFSSYIKENQIFRHFFWSEMSHKNTAKFITTIPLNGLQPKNHYQSGIFRRTTKDESNVCLTQILQNKNISESCKPTMSIYQEGKVILGQHNTGFENITISVRGENFIEIYCQGNTQIFFAKGVKVMSIPRVCKLVINDQTFQEGSAEPSKFLIQMLYEGNNRQLNPDHPPNINLMIITIAIFSLLGIGCTIVAIWSCCKRGELSRAKSTYFQIAEQMPEVTEIIQPVEQTTRFPKQMTKL